MFEGEILIASFSKLFSRFCSYFKLNIKTKERLSITKGIVTKLFSPIVKKYIYI